MQMLFKANGDLDTSYRPKIDEEQSTRVFTLYNVDEPVNWGFYESNVLPYKGSLNANFVLNNPQRRPVYSVGPHCKRVPNDETPSTNTIVATVYPEIARRQREMESGRNVSNARQRSRCSCGCVRAECRCSSSCACRCNS